MILSFGLLCFQGLIPGFFSYLILKNSLVLEKSEFKRKFSVLYEDYKLPLKDKALILMVIYFQRRMLMSLLIILLSENSNIQIFTLILQSLVTLMIQLTIRPYATALIGFIEVFNELSILIILYGILSISIGSEDLQVWMLTSYMVIIFILLNIAVNWIVFISNLILFIYQKLRKLYDKFQIAQSIKAEKKKRERDFLMQQVEKEFNERREKRIQQEVMKQNEAKDQLQKDQMIREIESEKHFRDKTSKVTTKKKTKIKDIQTQSKSKGLKKEMKQIFQQVKRTDERPQKSKHVKKILQNKSDQIKTITTARTTLQTNVKLVQNHLGMNNNLRIDQGGQVQGYKNQTAFAWSKRLKHSNLIGSDSKFYHLNSSEASQVHQNDHVQTMQEHRVRQNKVTDLQQHQSTTIEDQSIERDLAYNLELEEEQAFGLIEEGDDLPTIDYENATQQLGYERNQRISQLQNVMSQSNFDRNDESSKFDPALKEFQSEMEQKVLQDNLNEVKKKRMAWAFIKN